MSMKIKDPETGEEREVFTPDEVEEREKNVRAEIQKESETKIEEAKKDAVEQYKKDNPDKTQELQDLENKLTTAESELQAAQSGGSDAQIQRLRQERDEAKQNLDKVQNDFNENIKQVTSRIEGIEKQRIDEYKEQLIGQYAKGDDELKKKIEYEFDNYRSSDTSREAINDRVTKAAQLAGAFDVSAGSPIASGLGAGVRGAGGGEPQQTEWNDNAKSIGNALGISEEDRQKYGRK